MTTRNVAVCAVFAAVCLPIPWAAPAEPWPINTAVGGGAKPL